MPVPVKRRKKPQVSRRKASAARSELQGPTPLLAVADFGDEVGEAGFDFGASERLGTLAAHGVTARSSLEFCFVNVQSDRIAHGLSGKGQGATSEFLRPGVCRCGLLRFHLAPAVWGFCLDEFISAQGENP
jgi:hypothetical protein